MQAGVILWLESFGGFIDFVIRTCGSVPVAVFYRLGEVIRQFEQVAVKSFPIIVGAGLSVGIVGWFQTHRLLVAHGAEATLPSFLAVVVLVEVGPILAGLMAAARMGGRPGGRVGLNGVERGNRRPYRPRRRSRGDTGCPPGDRLCTGRPVIDGDHRRLGALAA